jgi:hypothetical protein
VDDQVQVHVAVNDDDNDNDALTSAFVRRRPRRIEPRPRWILRSQRIPG